ncbi:MAG TPA: glycosyl hydrolase, partial [Chthonomonadaceae bacterium]|nr:glycosyl hydrolase [Chthonomonadaceae bacterium]
MDSLADRYRPRLAGAGSWSASRRSGSRPPIVGRRSPRDVLRALIACLACAMPVRAAAQADPVAAGFRDVPAESRMRMFWRVFGPAWSPPETDRELREVKAAGLGGLMTAITYPAAVDDPAAGIVNQRYLSPEFLDTLRYAESAAHSLGLEFNAYGGTGWPFGGPTVSLADSAHRIRMERPAPLPDGTGWRLRRLRDGESYFAAYVMPVRETSATAPASIALDVTRSIHGDRLERRPGPDDQAAVFIVGPTYMKVKRPALGGEGYVVDHYSRPATLRYLDSAVAPLLDGSPPGAGIQTIFCDSLEVYGANWTDSLPAEFERRRGYALTPHLPALFDATAADSPELRFDFWRTLAELAEENFVRTTHDWLRARGVWFALQAYGTPPLGLTAAAECDFPWGEQYEYRGFSFSRLAASGAHLAGKRIVGAEAWTWAGIPNRVADSLADLKLLSDFHFLAGENELTGVDFPYSPASAGSPGWMPYFGPVMNRNNPQWAVFPDLVGYVNRCQWILRQGRPVADVALYLPEEDAFAAGPVDQMLLDFKIRDYLATTRTDEFGLQKALRHNSEIIDGIQRAGLNFDGVDFFAMNRLCSVQGSELVAGDGRYRVLILDTNRIDLAALRKIAAFCRAGGTVISMGHPPELPAGRASSAAADEVRRLIVELFGLSSSELGASYEAEKAWAAAVRSQPDLPAPTMRHAVGKGFTLQPGMARAPKGRLDLTSNLDEWFPRLTGGDLTAALRSVLRADIERTGPVSSIPNTHGQSARRIVRSETDQAIYHVHRACGDRDFYFVCRLPLDSGPLHGELRGAGRLTFWDPFDGSIRAVPAHSHGGRTAFTLAEPRSGFL